MHVVESELFVSDTEKPFQDFNACYTLVSPVFHCSYKDFRFLSDCSCVILGDLGIWICVFYFFLFKKNSLAVFSPHKANNYWSYTLFLDFPAHKIFLKRISFITTSFCYISSGGLLLNNYLGAC